VGWEDEDAACVARRRAQIGLATTVALGFVDGLWVAAVAGKLLLARDECSF